MNTANTQQPDDGSKEYLAGLEAYIDGKHDEAIDLYTKAANKGHVEAMNRLGNIYQNGKGVAQNYVTARQWYVKAGNEERIIEIDRMIAETSASTASAAAADGEEEYRAGNEALDYGEHAKAVECFTKAAAKGNTSAMNYLGHACKHGTGVAQNYAEAIKWYTNAADRGHKIAMKNLGEMYENGMGIAKNYAKAREYYVKSGNDWCVERIDRLIAEASTNTTQADQNDGSEEYRAGKEAYDNGEYKIAIELFIKAAANGHVDGMSYLGLMYYKGWGVMRDYAKAREWLTRAADKGNADAMNDLGLMYYKGRGVMRDYAKAREWLTRAADKGSADAMNNLGMIYYDGLGVAQNFAKACEWLTQAAEKGYTAAMYNLGYLYYNDTGDEQDYVKAREWFTHAAYNGDTSSMNFLGYMYVYGYGVAQDYVKAREWYVKAGDKKCIAEIDQLIRNTKK